MSSIIEEQLRDLAKKLAKIPRWEQTVDGLGMEDFPERDYFMEAEQLLREAREALRKAAACYAVERYRGKWLDIATRIDKLLAD